MKAKYISGRSKIFGIFIIYKCCNLLFIYLLNAALNFKVPIKMQTLKTFRSNKTYMYRFLFYFGRQAVPVQIFTTSHKYINVVSKFYSKEDCFWKTDMLPKSVMFNMQTNRLTVAMITKCLSRIFKQQFSEILMLYAMINNKWQIEFRFDV